MRPEECLQGMKMKGDFHNMEKKMIRSFEDLIVWQKAIEFALSPFPLGPRARVRLATNMNT